MLLNHFPSNLFALSFTVFFYHHAQVFFLLFLGLGLSLTIPATAQSRPKLKARRAFSHTSESGQGKNNKIQFRRESNRPVIDMKPHKLESFKTAKSPKPYKYYNPR
ncbi:hypothetical protein [Hymenobacter siberiensis]|uniref:hypothetical protein n=1 Tax=Hymenobacter siberiensis TaxID=2848396 RepID=UPI001C1E6D1C|nr:hypothetical protein [Hymenobacter siberiensis]MBU6122526.1 hypothetical protein [Hymenobacter siberiensis]